MVYYLQSVVSVNPSVAKLNSKESVLTTRLSPGMLLISLLTGTGVRISDLTGFNGVTLKVAAKRGIEERFQHGPCI